jgi:hypothetical protein
MDYTWGMEITVRYTLTFEEFARFQGEHSTAITNYRGIRGAEKLMKRLWVWALVCLVLFWIYLFFQKSAPPEGHDLVRAAAETQGGSAGATTMDALPYVCIFLVLSVFFWGRSKRAKKRLWNELAELHEETTLTVTDAGVSLANSIVRYEYPWAGFVHCYESPTLFFLCTSRYGAHFVPKRVFANAGEARDFGEFCRVKILGG